MNPEATRYPRYRWVILGIAWLVLACIGWSHFLIPSLAYRLIPELGLTHMQFTLIFTAPILVSVFSSIPGGVLADRYGIRPVVAIAILIAGLSGLARAFTPSFEGMLALMCLFGIPFGMVIPNLPKLVSVWFPPQQTGLVSGIYTTALGIGSSLGLLTGPLFGNWKTAFISVGIITVAVSLLWAVLGRSAPAGVKIEMPPLVSGIKSAARSKNIWLVAMAQLFFMGAFMAFSQNLPKALENVHQVSPEAAGAIASLLTLGAAIGHIAIPILSDRGGLRKIFIYVGALTSAICLFFAWRLAPTGVTPFLILLGGFLYGGIPPILFTFPVELPEIGQEHVGGAAGVIGALQNIGGFLIPFLVVSPLVAAETSRAYNTGFLVVALLFAAIALPTIFVTETGARARCPKG